MAQSAHHLASDAANRRPAGAGTASHRTRVVLVSRPLGLSVLALAATAIGVSLVLWAEAPTWKRSLLLGLTGAAAVLSKFTALGYLPAAAVLALLA